MDSTTICLNSSQSSSAYFTWSRLFHHALIVHHSSGRSKSKTYHTKFSRVRTNFTHHNNISIALFDFPADADGQCLAAITPGVSSAASRVFSGLRDESFSGRAFFIASFQTSGVQQQHIVKVIKFIIIIINTKRIM